MALSKLEQSFSALSMSQPEKYGSLIAAGVLAVGAVAIITHKKWSNYQEHKHKAMIEAINQLHKQFLEKINVPGYGEIPGFPPIFKFGPENNSQSVDSLHYTEAEIKDIGQNPPQIDAVLASYQQEVLNALLQLKAYALCRSEKEDVSAGVLSYLLNMLQTKCLSFAGYDNDIAYLGALAQFVDVYASQEGRINSQHFSRLSPVYTSLLNAKQKLEAHKESLSLKELVDELRITCMRDSNQLLRLLIQMVLPTAEKELADTAIYRELMANIVRKEYIKIQKHGLVFSKEPKVHLPESVFKNWIMGLAQYYLQSLEPNTMLQGQNTFQPEALFAFANWAGSVLTKQDKTRFAKALDLIRSVFQHTPNFINTKLAGTEKKALFVAVTAESEILNRTMAMANFAHLIHGIISLQAFCTHLIHSIEQLGAIYVNDPHHFKQIFTILDNLCEVVHLDLKKNKQTFLDIEIANKNTMRLAGEGVFPQEVEDVLNSVEHMLLKLGEKVKNYKTKHTEPADAATKAEIYDMLSVAKFFERMYLLAPAPDKVEQELPPAPMQTQTLPELPEAVLNNLGNQLFVIQKQEPKYQALSNTLKDLRIKAIAMLAEKNQEPSRADKAQKTYELTRSLYESTLVFFSQSNEAQTAQADTFIQSVHAKLNKPENSLFIDRHYNSVSKFIYEHLGFFQTATRHKFSAVERACDDLRSDISKPC